MNKNIYMEALHTNKKGEVTYYKREQWITERVVIQFIDCPRDLIILLIEYLYEGGLNNGRGL